ncbi:DUF2339 domain-containing protein [Bacillus cereus group sp. TH152-1LC]|uniref:DUF2339 domain-containing protein n=1 Tax=Bacillus cereus group sp. TH152-1LC TaxID=3018060 RepID=UPI0022E3C95C|nr:DUF2339 domain-containing protein [Bacillus cereus group sp. TH152-1LC]MDA1674595.1 DUF2339 domain-containing protein [Bacillus cereus group sp. TH152-1LC]
MSDDKKVSDLERRVEELEKEVVFLKKRVFGTEAIKEEPAIPQTTNNKPSMEQKPTGVNVPLDSVIASSKKPVPKKEEVDWEKLLGQVWLPRVFIFVLILGILWGFKAAVDSGFITEPIRAMLGFITSGLLLYVGERQIQKKRGALGQVLLGGSVVILILTTFAAHNLYGLIGPTFAFILNVLWVMVAIYLSHRHNSQPVSIIAAVAGFLIPYLIESKSGNEFLLVGYEVLFFIALLYYSLLKKYVYLYFTSGGLLHVTLLALYFFAAIQDNVATIGIIIQHIFLLIAFLRKDLFINAQRATLFTSFILTQLWVGVGFSSDQYSIFLLVSFMVYAVLSFVYFGIDKIKLNVTLPIATYALAMFILDMANGEHIGLMFLIEGLVAFYIGLKAKTKTQTGVGLIVYVSGVAEILCSGINHVFSLETIAWVMMISSLLLIRKIFSTIQVRNEEISNIMNVLFGSTAIAILMFITQIGGAATQNLSTNVQSLTISSLWAIYAVAGVVYGVLSGNKNIRLLGIGLLFLTLLKLIFIDMTNVSIIVRAILFIGLGFIGVALSRFFYSNKKED